jgi:hypothetical protein
MGNTLFGTSQAYPGQQLSRPQDSLKTKQIDKLPPAQRKWSDNVLKVLKLPSKGSQARIMAGAISTSEMIRQNHVGTQDPQKLQDVQEAQRLKDVVLRAGNPPWKDMKKAMNATGASVKLDLLSLPPPRQITPKPGNGNVNSTFWVDRKEPDGTTRAAYLCKTPSIGSANQPVGVPDGGEVAREALSSRVAQTLARQTGIDIGMPESHVVSLGVNEVPPGTIPNGQNDVSCSVQEALESTGPLDNLSRQQKAQINAEQIAGLAIFDTITLNTDRHPGNILMGPNNELIPIDHGASLVNTEDEGFGIMSNGIGRISDMFGSRHNCLLGLPGAHEPLSPAMLKKLKALDVSDLGKSLTRDRDAIVEDHPTMQNTVSDGAITAAKRSAAFLKMAAKIKPTMSIAQVQVALGNAAGILLDPGLGEDQFKNNAAIVLQDMAQQQEVVKDFCTAEDTEYAALLDEARSLGWPVQLPGRPQVSGVISDPVLLLRISQTQTQAPARNQQQAVLNGLRGTPMTKQQGIDALVALKIRVLRKLEPLVTAPGQISVETIVRALGQATGEQKLKALSGFIRDFAAKAVTGVQTQLTALQQQWVIPQTDRFLAELQDCLQAVDPLGALDELNSMQLQAQANRYQPVQQQGGGNPQGQNQGQNQGGGVPLNQQQGVGGNVNQGGPNG